VVRGEPGSGRFSVFRFDADRLVAVESVNRTVDHIAARKVLAGHMLPSPDEVAEPEFELRQFVAGVPTG
jgi:3-phenylpropionate/trans-cinnamate dioxygenase ferredoxin reductase subunit